MEIVSVFFAILPNPLAFNPVWFYMTWNLSKEKSFDKYIPPLSYSSSVEFSLSDLLTIYLLLTDTDSFKLLVTLTFFEDKKTVSSLVDIAIILETQ